MVDGFAFSFYFSFRVFQKVFTYDSCRAKSHQQARTDDSIVLSLFTFTYKVTDFHQGIVDMFISIIPCFH